MYELEVVLAQALGERLVKAEPTLWIESSKPLTSRGDVKVFTSSDLGIDLGVGADGRGTDRPVLDEVVVEGLVLQIDWDSPFGDPAEERVPSGTEPGVRHVLHGLGQLPAVPPGAQLALLLEQLAAESGELAQEDAGTSDGEEGAESGGAGQGPLGVAGVLVEGKAGSATSTGTDDPYVAVEMVAAWERLAAWAKAQSALAAARVSRLTEMNPIWPESSRSVAVPSVAGEELAMRLGCSRAAARELISMGRGFEGALLPTGEAMLAGEIDPPKARVILKHLEDTPGQTAWGVQEEVLPGAGTRTPAQLAGDLRRALISIDPAEAEARRVRATQKRRICRPRALPDGMAGIWAVLPAPQAVRVDSALDGLARSLRVTGDARTLDQLRADIFAHTLEHQDLIDADPTFTGRTATGPMPPGPTLPDPMRPGPAFTGQRVTDSASSDPAPTDQESTDRALKNMALTDQTLAGRPPTGSTLSPSGPRRPRAPALINVTVPLTTLMGVDDQPAELAGYGAITAHAARELAAQGVWRRIVTDPLTGSAVDVGRTRYSPPARLVDHIRQRDQVCARPGCSAPAASCDLDHTIEFTRADGTTAHTNLGPLCPRDHQIKTDGGFRVSQPEPGVFDWITPTEHSYRVWPGDHGRYEITGFPIRVDQQPESEPPKPHPWDGPPPF